MLKGAVTLRGTLSVDEGSMYGFTGFRTKVYFKNPGFKKGDRAGGRKG